MNRYVAGIKDREGNMTLLKMEYNSKKEFKRDIHHNGYTIEHSYIFTEEEYEKFIEKEPEFMDWFINRLDKRTARSKAQNYIRKSIRKQGRI